MMLVRMINDLAPAALVIFRVVSETSASNFGIDLSEKVDFYVNAKSGVNKRSPYQFGQSAPLSRYESCACHQALL